MKDPEVAIVRKINILPRRMSLSKMQIFAYNIKYTTPIKTVIYSDERWQQYMRPNCATKSVENSEIQRKTFIHLKYIPAVTEHCMWESEVFTRCLNKIGWGQEVPNKILGE